MKQQHGSHSSASYIALYYKKPPLGKIDTGSA